MKKPLIYSKDDCSLIGLDVSWPRSRATLRISGGKDGVTRVVCQGILAVGFECVGPAHKTFPLFGDLAILEHSPTLRSWRKYMKRAWPPPYFASLEEHEEMVNGPLYEVVFVTPQTNGHSLVNGRGFGIVCRWFGLQTPRRSNTPVRKASRRGDKRRPPRP